MNFREYELLTPLSRTEYVVSCLFTALFEKNTHENAHGFV